MIMANNLAKKIFLGKRKMANEYILIVSWFFDRFVSVSKLTKNQTIYPLCDYFRKIVA